MGLSRKRTKQLTKLRKTASALWEEQQAVLVHAGDVSREAGRQLSLLSQEEVVPRIKDTVDGSIVPTALAGYAASKAATSNAAKKVAKASTGVASSIAALELLKEPHVANVLKEAGKVSGAVSKNAAKTFSAASKKGVDLYETVGTKAGFVKPQPKAGLGAGGWVLVVIGVITVVGIAYAVWQTLRADDELWVLDEKDDAATPE
jgi:hypothetical protein